MAETRELVPIGTIIKPYGKVSAVGCLQGERYYWFVASDKSIAMMPACMIERMVDGRN